MEELLKVWGCEAFVNTFLVHEVDIEALPLLDDGQIKVLIPAIGPQAKFKQALRDWKLTLQNTELNDIITRYGENIGGLTPTRSSPICSTTSSPSTLSACSVVTDDRQLSADFHEWYPGNINSFENKFPLLKNKLIATFEKTSKKSQYIAELKTLAKSVGAGEVLEVTGSWEEGPAFLPTRRNVVAAPGGEAVLACRVAHLGDKAVSWVRARDLQILAHAGFVFAADPRVAASVAGARDDVTHTLRIARLRPADAGRYECQLNTEPKLSQIYNLTVRESTWSSIEVHPLGAATVRAGSGSAATLGCAAQLRPRAAPGAPSLRAAWYRDGRPLLPQSGRSSGGVSLDTERAAGRVTSRLTLAALAPRDAGRYVCRVTPQPPDPDWEGGGDEELEGEVALTLLVTDDADAGAVEAMQRDQGAPAGGGRPAPAPALLPALLLLLLLLAAARR